MYKHKLIFTDVSHRLTCAGMVNEQTTAMCDQACTNMDHTAMTHSPTGSNVDMNRHLSDEAHSEYETVSQYDLTLISSSQMETSDSEQQPSTSLNICYLTLPSGK